MSRTEEIVASSNRLQSLRDHFTLHRLMHPSGDDLFEILSTVFACSAIVIIALSAVVLIRDSFQALSTFGVGFITGVDWNTTLGQESYGMLPYIFGTLVTSGIAIAIGIPVSLGIAIFLSEMAPTSLRAPLAQLVELLAAVPSIIYGFWGRLVLRNWVVTYVEIPLTTRFGSVPIFRGAPNGYDNLMGGLILAIMIIPTISSISKEVMMAVPSSQREAAYSIGATKWETVRIGVLSYSRSGIFGATILGLGRAIGETMAITLVIGGALGPNALPTSLFIPGQTLSSLIAGQYFEAASQPLQLSAVVGAGLVLFGLAIIINVFAQLMVSRVLKLHAGAVE
jgi:phosphate transport system permease protein